MEKLQKIAFPKQTDDVDVKKDLGLDHPEGVVFRFWNNPSRAIIRTILRVLLEKPKDLATMSEDDQEKLMEDFYRALAAYIVDTNLEALSFNTPEEAEKSFMSDDLPFGFVYEVVVTYTLKQLVESDRLKKAVGLLSSAGNSGKDNESKEEKLNSESPAA